MEEVIESLYFNSINRAHCNLSPVNTAAEEYQQRNSLLKPILCTPLPSFTLCFIRRFLFHFFPFSHLPLSLRQESNVYRKQSGRIQGNTAVRKQSADGRENIDKLANIDIRHTHLRTHTQAWPNIRYPQTDVLKLEQITSYGNIKLLLFEPLSPPLLFSIY